MKKIASIVNSNISDNKKTIWLNYYTHLTNDIISEIPRENNFIESGRIYCENENSYFFNEKHKISPAVINISNSNDRTTHFFKQFFKDDYKEHIQPLQEVLKHNPDIEKIITYKDDPGTIGWNVFFYSGKELKTKSNSSDKRIMNILFNENANEKFKNYNIYLKSIFGMANTCNDNVLKPTYIESVDCLDVERSLHEPTHFYFFNLTTPFSNDYSGTLMVVSTGEIDSDF